MSRYLADDNIPAPTILARRAAGFDVAAISETDAGSPSDEEHAALTEDLVIAARAFYLGFRRRKSA